MERLKDKVAIVTGAAGGIGQATAELFAREGATVGLVDKDESGLQNVQLAMEQTGARVVSEAINITDYQRLKSFRDRLVGEFGSLDLIVNNAAIPHEKDFLSTTLEEWKEVITVDLESVYMASKLAAEVMSQQRSGRIINIASIQAFMTTGNTGAYNAAKAAVLGFTRATAVDLAPYNIIVNAIAPGFIHSGMSITAEGIDETTTPEFQLQYISKRRIPLARVGQPEDVAHVALFLASDDCRYMTGQTLIVDGGLTLTI